MADTKPNAQVIKELDQAVDRLSPTDKGNVNKFLEDVSSTLDAMKPQERQDFVKYVSAKLDAKGALPDLFINTDMTKGNSRPFRDMGTESMPGSLYSNLTKADLEKLASSGKKDGRMFDAGSQLLATSLLRRFDEMDGKYTKDEKVSGFEVQKWTADEKAKRKDRVENGDEHTYRSDVRRVLTQFDSPDALRAAFGTDRPNREKIMAAIKTQEDNRQFVNKITEDPKEREALIAKASAKDPNAVWPSEKLAAAQYMVREEAIPGAFWDGKRSYYDAIQGAKNENGTFSIGRGDWISADKIQEFSKSKGVTLDGIRAEADQIDAAKTEAANLAASLIKKDSEKKPETEVDKLKAQIEELKKIVEAGKPPAAKPPEAKPPEVKPPVPAPAEADAKAKAETAAKVKAEADAKAKAEADAKAKAEADVKAKPADDKAKAEADAKAKAEADAKTKAEADAKAKAEADAKSKAEADAKAKTDAANKAKAEADAAKTKAEADAKAKAEADAKAKAEADAKAKAEVKPDAAAKAKAEADAKAKAEADAKTKAEADAKVKAEADAKVKAEADAKVKAEAAAKAKALSDEQKAQAELQKLLEGK